MITFVPLECSYCPQCTDEKIKAQRSMNINIRFESRPSVYLKEPVHSLSHQLSSHSAITEESSSASLVVGRIRLKRFNVITADILM